MPRLRSVLIAFLVVLLLGSFAAWRLVQSDHFWRWAGRLMVAQVDKRINGTLTVKEIRGNPINGLIFEEISLSSPEGEIFRLKSLEVRASLWSLVKLRPVVGKLALTEPRLNLRQDEGGQWNISQLFPAGEKPADGGTALPFRSLDFHQILLVDGDVTINQEGRQTRYHHLDADVTVALEKFLTPEQTLRISRAQAAVITPMGRFALAISLDFGKQRLELRTLSLEADQERLLLLSGKADLAAKPGDLLFTGEIGPTQGETIRGFWAQWPSAWEVGGALQVKGTMAQVEMKLEGKIHQAPYRLKGTLAEETGKWHYDAVLDVDGLKPEILAAWDKAWAEKSTRVSPLSLHLRATGLGLAWPPEQLTYTLESKPFDYGDMRVEQLKVVAQGSDKEHKIEANLKGNFGSASLSGHGSLFPAPVGEVKVQAKSLRPGLLGLKAPEGTRLDVNLSASLGLPDWQSLDRLKVSGEVEATGQAGGHPLGELKGRFTWQRPDLDIPRLQVRLGNMAAEFKGSLKGERLDFAWSGRSTPGGHWPIPSGVEGHLAWNGRLRGTISDPEFFIQAQGRSLAYDNYAIQDFRLTAGGRGWPPRSGSIVFQGKKFKTPAGVFAQVSFTGETMGERWNFRLDAASPKTPQVELAGSADLRSRPLEVTLDLFRFKMERVSGQNRDPLRLRFLPGFELEPATLSINQGSLTLEGRLQGEGVNGRLAAQDLPLELSGIKDLGGKLQANMSLEGSLASPGIQGEIRVETGRWRRLRFNAITSALQYRDNFFRFNGTIAESTTGAKGQWESRLPLTLVLRPWRFALAEEDLSVRVRGEGVNLGMLTEFSDEVQAAAAPIELAAEVRGPWSKPLVSGQMKWGAGFIIARQSGARFEVEPGTMNLEGERLSLPQLTLKSDGTGTLRGEVTLAGFQPAEVTARVQFSNFRVLDRLRSQAYVNGQVFLDGPWKALALTGRLVIPRANLTPQLFKLGSTEINPDIVLVREKKKIQQEEVEPVEPDFLKNLRVAVIVDGRDNIWLRDKNANVEASLAVRINKPPGEEVVVGGMIRSLRGDISIQGRDFKLVKGLVDLPFTPGLEPYVDARAVHETWDVTIMVDVTGTPRNPRLELSSEPSLPKSEILSYLVFGRPSSALSQEEFNTSKLAGGVLGGLTAHKVQEILGPDFPLLGDATLRTGQTLGIVKPLTKGLTLTLGSETTPEGKRGGFQAKLGYRVNRNIKLEAQTGANPGADVFLNYDF